MRKLLVVVVMCCVVTVCGAGAGEWRFPVRLSYPTGAQDVIDAYEDYGNADASTLSGAGISFAPYMQFDHGSRVGGGLGPIFIIVGDLSHWDVPLSVTYGFTLLPDADVSPYAYLGPIYHVAGGDFYEDASPGLVVGIGVEFKRETSVGFGFELAYDSSEMTLGYGWLGRDVKPGEVVVSGFVVF